MDARFELLKADAVNIPGDVLKKALKAAQCFLPASHDNAPESLYHVRMRVGGQYVYFEATDRYVIGSVEVLARTSIDNYEDYYLDPDMVKHLVKNISIKEDYYIVPDTDGWKIFDSVGWEVAVGYHSHQLFPQVGRVLARESVVFPSEVIEHSYFVDADLMRKITAASKVLGKQTIMEMESKSPDKVIRFILWNSTTPALTVYGGVKHTRLESSFSLMRHIDNLPK